MRSKLFLGLIALIVSSSSLAVDTTQTTSANSTKKVIYASPERLGSQVKWEAEGLVVLQYDSSRGESGRFGTDPYAILGLTLTPYKRLDFYTLLVQTREFEVDEAIVVWHALPDSKLDLFFGRQYLPFGSYETEMVSDPLTQVLGDIRGEEVFIVSTESDYFSASAYVFEGTSSLEGSDKHDQGYGFRIGYENDDYQFGVDYVSNLAESNQFSSNEIPKSISGIALYGSYEWDHFTLIGEHITSTQPLRPGDLYGEITLAAQPSATHIEVDIELNSNEVLAFAWNETRDTEELEEETTQQYWGASYSRRLYDHLTGAIEIAEFTSADGTTDETVNLQVIFDF